MAEKLQVSRVISPQRQQGIPLLALRVGENGESAIHIDEFDYELPPDLIAQEPCAERDQSRLLVVRRGGEVQEHRQFRDLPSLLEAGDLLVFNDTRVIPARVVGRRARTEGKWEGLILRAMPDGNWELLCQTRGRLIVGETLLVDGPEGDAACPPLRLCLVGKTPAGRWLAQPGEPGSASELLARYGRVPLPPYIRKGRAAERDRERYQTVYAQHAGAVAAPTAGLHFTPAVFEQLKQRGIEQAFVTLHVGPGTFQPVQVEEVTQHRMESEWGELSAETAEAINACKARGRRVVAVGTTCVRVLETAAQRGLPLTAWSGDTDLTIAPPFDFRAVDALITNFHLPRSSLLLLVGAFTGMDSMRQAYQAAIEQRYRFYSYGDAMLIL
ncbi:MAG TPA: tRNA preQ1(34) S-adenosylmethionine ribosyltransferase-isomerase QueA [Gemmataceae bacterium]|nr:tRNA preQ1(34) S-adenosylmethionine ribosyltransferase-isomerase QueA [Gemmataceae bacterium]